eukprot:TRINITY_DN249_c0_g1_i4.p1 TRINITY_DN249_c0_g1~~TRINITY_DN249_c0_g1_i4.p1  ORF type:complete len:139 (+),score=4.45 TRINITY_DN249_c0_g1_i4:131-547(+)
MSLGLNYSPARLRMERARTPMGSVPISTIWGYDYPLSDVYHDSISRNVDDFKESVDSIMRRSRAASESRILDSYPLRRETDSFSYSTTPWNATGFYYSPRYPMSFGNSYSSVNPIKRYYYDYEFTYPYRYPSSYRNNW